MNINMTITMVIFLSDSNRIDIDVTEKQPIGDAEPEA